MEPSIYICLIASLVVLSVAHWKLSTNTLLYAKATFGKSFWYQTGILLGENVLINPSTQNNKQRWLTGIWMLSSLLIMSGLGGVLRALLLKPQRGTLINTFQEVISSGIPWKMYNDTDLEGIRKNNDNPTVRRILDNRIVLPYDPLYLNEVRGWSSLIYGNSSRV